jgi:hypothetical protein
MNQMKPEQREALDKAFREGKSTRAAARVAGVAKGTATRFRLKQGGMEAYRELGATFKQNRWL